MAPGSTPQSARCSSTSASTALLVGAAVRPVVIRRRPSVTVLLGTLFPLAAGVLYTLGITPLEGLDMAPIDVARTRAEAFLSAFLALSTQ